jgi:hypothetical protein
MPVGSVDVLAEPWEPSCGDARAAGSTGALLPPALRCELCLKAVHWTVLATRSGGGGSGSAGS